MALRKATLVFGIEFGGAYHRIENVRIQGKTAILFDVKSYADQSQGVAFVEKVQGCSYDLNGKNPIAQAYDFVKTLPEFVNSQDC
jgi:hypothetical protein